MIGLSACRARAGMPAPRTDFVKGRFGAIPRNRATLRLRAGRQPPRVIPSDGTRKVSNMCSVVCLLPESPPRDERPVESLEQEICELAAHIAVATCRWLELVAEFDDRGGGAEGGVNSCAHWLSWRGSLGVVSPRG